MFSALSPTYKGILLALTGYTAFSVADICAKWLTQSYSIYQVIVIDSAFACALLLALSPWLGGIKSMAARKNLKLHASRVVLNFIINILVVYCFTQLPLADMYALIFTAPFMAAILALFLFGETVTRSRWLAIAAGFAGTVVALKPGNGAIDPALLLALLSAVVISLMFILTRFMHEPSIFAISIYPIGGAMILTVPLMMADYRPVELAHLPVFILQGASVALAISCVSLAFRAAAAAVVSPFMYLQMIWAIIFGYLLFGDVPDGMTLGGAAIIIASGFYLIETERRNFSQ